MTIMGVIHFVIVVATAIAVLMAGAVKLTDELDKDLHTDMTVNFKQKFTPIWTEKVFSRDLPGPLADGSKWLQDPEHFQQLTGALEIGSAAGLLFFTCFGLRFLRNICLFILVVLFSCATLTHVWIDEDPTPPACMLFLLSLVVLSEPAPVVKQHRA